MQWRPEHFFFSRHVARISAICVSRGLRQMSSWSVWYFYSVISKIYQISQVLLVLHKWRIWLPHRSHTALQGALPETRFDEIDENKESKRKCCSARSSHYNKHLSILNRREKTFNKIYVALQRALPKASIGEIVNRQKQKVEKTDVTSLLTFTQTKWWYFSVTAGLLISSKSYLIFPFLATERELLKLVQIILTSRV